MTIEGADIARLVMQEKISSFNYNIVNVNLGLPPTRLFADFFTDGGNTEIVFKGRMRNNQNMSGQYEIA